MNYCEWVKLIVSKIPGLGTIRGFGDHLESNPGPSTSVPIIIGRSEALTAWKGKGKAISEPIG